MKDPAQVAAQFAELERQGVAQLGPLRDDLCEYYMTVPLQLPGRDTPWESKVKIIRPRSAVPGATTAPSPSTGPQHHPLVILFHGGGFQVGSPEQMTRAGRSLAAVHGAVVACPSYPLVPHDPAANRWPAAQHAAWAFTCWAASARELGASPGDVGLVVGGHSAGGNLAAVVAGLSAFGLPEDDDITMPALCTPVTGVFLNCPIIFFDRVVPDEHRAAYTSYEDNADAPPLPAARIREMLHAHAPDARSRWWSPAGALLAVRGDDDRAAAARFFPPCWIQTGGLDPLRDDGVVFGKMLAARGYRTRAVSFPEDAHAWYGLPAPLKSSGPTMAESTDEAMRWLLER